MNIANRIMAEANPLVVPLGRLLVGILDRVSQGRLPN